MLLLLTALAITQLTDAGVWHLPQKRPAAVVLPHAGAHIDDLLPQQTAAATAAKASASDSDAAANDDHDSVSDESVPHDDDCGAGAWLCIDVQAGLKQKGLTSSRKTVSDSSSSCSVSSTALTQQQQPAAAAADDSTSSSTAMAAA
jgi:hypothetical protein